MKGKRAAHNLFYDKFRNLLMSISCRYASSPDEVNDIFQEAFIKVFEGLKKLKNAEALSTWVYRCAVNVAIDHHKSKQRSWQITNEYPTEEANEDHSEIMDSLSGEELLKIIGELPEGYKVVFNLYVIDGFKHKEIAEMLGITENTSRSQLRDARTALKKVLINRGIFKYERV